MALWFLNLWKLRKVEICYLLTFLLVLTVALSVGLSDDEAYYWSWSLKPDFSYFDHPPLLAWTLWLTTHIFGKTNFAVRLPALLSFLTCSFLLIRWAKRYKIPSKDILALCMSTPLFFIFSWITLPDVLFLPLGLLALDFLMNKKFLFCGLILGLALLSKWHTFLLMPGIFLAVLLMGVSFSQKTKALFKIFIPAFILQAPVIYWNWTHQWAAFRYHLVERFGNSWGSFMDMTGRGTGFLICLLLFFGFPFIYLFLKGLSSSKRKLQWGSEDLVLIALGLPFIVIFGLSALKGETRIYWTGFAFFPLSIFLLKRLSQEAHQRLRSLAVMSCFIYMSLLSICLYTPVGSYARPIIEQFRPYDVRLSPRGGMVGWSLWAKKEIKEEQLPGKKVLFLATDFRLASQVLWNTDLGFDQVSSTDRTHQYSIWPIPDISSYSKAIIFGDNQRQIENKEWDKACHTPLQSKEYFKVLLLSRVIKVIEDMECYQLKNKESG